MRRPLAGALAVLTFLLVVSSVATGRAAAQSEGACTGVATGDDGWEAIAAPEFPSGGDSITAYAVAAGAILVSNGPAIMRSVDGGCTFGLVADVTTGSPSATASISALEVDERGDSVYALVSGAPGAAPAVHASHDAGATWSSSSQGLLPAGTPLDLEVPAHGPLYLLVSAGPAASLVYASADGGTTWDLSGTATAGPGALTDLVPDPQSPETLWGAGGDGVYRSSDSGATWERVHETGGAVALVHSARQPNGGVRLLAFSAGGPVLWESRDRGRTWATGSTPETVPVESVADKDGAVAISLRSSAARVYRTVPTGWELVPPSLLLHAPFRGVSFDPAAPSTLYALTPEALMRWRDGTIGAITRRPPAIPGVQNKLCGNVHPLPGESWSRDPAIATLEPDGNVVELEPGATRTVPYTLDMTASPLPFDVYFLVDSSGSMGDTICALMEGMGELVTRVSATVPDVYFGLAEYNEHTKKGTEKPEGCGDDNAYTAYRRHRQIGPPDRALIEALGGLKVCGGDETALIALKESVTGLGQDLLPFGPSPNDIAPGTPAEFRPRSARVIVHAADEAFVEHADGPTREEATMLLRGEGVRQLGISGDTAAADLRAVAQGTGAVALRGGVDCDGDGVADLPEGAPLVCPMETGEDEVDFVPALIDMLLSVRDLHPVSFGTHGGEDVVAGLAPALYPAVDLLDPSSLGFDVTYACGLEDAGRTFEVEVGARSGSRLLATATTTVRCLPLPVAVPPPPQAAVAPAVVPPPPPPPPAPLPQAQPNAQPQPRIEQQAQQQVQQSTQAQAQAAAAAQRQEQPQAAFVHAVQSVREQVAMEGHAMTLTRGRRDPMGEMGLGLAGSSLTLLLAWGVTSFAFVSRTARAGGSRR